MARSFRGSRRRDQERRREQAREGRPTVPTAPSLEEQTVQAEKEAKLKAQQRATEDIKLDRVAAERKTPESEFKQTQRSLISALEAQARGEGPSLAQAQLKAGSDRALSQQLALAAQSRTPAQGALARRLASRQAGEQQQALAAQSGALALQEQLAARQAIGQVAQGARGLDVQVAGLNQADALQRALANQQIGATEFQLENQALATALGQQQSQINALNTQAQIEEQKAANARSGRNTAIGGILQAGGAILGGAAAAGLLSDANAKEDIQDLSKEDLKEFWNAYNPVTYKYKDSDMGTYPGFVIQDIENTKLGEHMVFTGEDGLKRVDTQKFLGVLAATIKEFV